MMLVSFTISKTKMLDVIKQFIKVVGPSKKKEATIEITVIDNNIVLVVPGIDLKLSAVTSGSAKFTVGLLYLSEILKSQQNDILQFLIKENLVRCNNTVFGVSTTFFETDEILRSIDLPINFINTHIAKLALSNKYTAGEIAFNSLEQQKEEALIMLKQDIDKITYIAQPYGISKRDIEDFIIYKIKEAN